MEEREYLINNTENKFSYTNVNLNKNKYRKITIITLILIILIILITTVSYIATAPHLMAEYPSLISFSASDFQGRIYPYFKTGITYQFEYKIVGNIYSSTTNIHKFNSSNLNVTQYVYDLESNMEYQYRIIAYHGSTRHESSPAKFKTLDKPHFGFSSIQNNMTNLNIVNCYGFINNTGSSILNYFIQYRLSGALKFDETIKYPVLNNFGMNNFEQYLNISTTNSWYEFRLAIIETGSKQYHHTLSTFTFIR